MNQWNNKMRQNGAGTKCFCAVSMAYYRHICPYGLAKFVRFAKNVWEVNPEGKTDEQIADGSFINEGEGLFQECLIQKEGGTDDMKKTLVAYFSASGVTERAAKVLAAAAGADLHEIKPTVPYTKEDLDWTDKQSRSTLEMTNLDSRPEITDKTEDMGEYDVVFVGFPIWWYTAPTIINTFLEAYDFSGKTIILFATSGGSGFGKAVQNLKGSISETAEIREGRLLNGTLDENELKTWVDGLNL